MKCEDNSGKNDTANLTKRDNIPKQRYILKRHAELLFRTLGAASVVTLAIGGAFLSYHRTISGCSFLVTAFTAIVLDVHVHYRYRFRDRRPVKWPPFIAGGLVAALALVTAALSPLLPDPPTFLVPAVTSLSRGGPGFGPVIASDGIGSFIVDRLIFSVMVNELQAKRNIQGYRLQIVTPAGDVIHTCHFDLRHMKIYWVFDDGSGASELGLDSLDAKLEKGIDPEAEISGWSAWQCMPLGCPSGEMQFVIKELTGRKEVVPLTSVRHIEFTQFLPPALLQPKPKVPLASLGGATPCVPE